MKLLIDIGNTRIKWATEENKIFSNSLAVEHNQYDFINLIQQAWIKIGVPKVIAVSCVSRVEIAKQLIELAKNIWPATSIIVAKSLSSGFSVTNAYKDANKLGVDRWLGLIALQHYYPGNSIVVDCGTAITIDALNNHGVHLGGVISPGLALMQQALFQGTERLSIINQTFSVGLSNFTESAIYSGTVYAAVGLIEKVVADVCDNCQTLVLTGGDAELLAQHLNCKAILEPDFIVKGLALYSEGKVK
ncbi:MAG: type III pantothenate kinase [Methylococcales bacterium]